MGDAASQAGRKCDSRSFETCAPSSARRGLGGSRAQRTREGVALHSTQNSLLLHRTGVAGPASVVPIGASLVSCLCLDVAQPALARGSALLGRCVMTSASLCWRNARVVHIQVNRGLGSPPHEPHTSAVCAAHFAQTVRVRVALACANGAHAGLACVARRMTLLRAEHTSTKPVQLRPVALTVALKETRTATPTSRPRCCARGRGSSRTDAPPGAMTAGRGALRGRWKGELTLGMCQGDISQEAAHAFEGTAS